MTVETEALSQPWIKIEALVTNDDASALVNFLETLSASETARSISRLSPTIQGQLLLLLEPQEAADLLYELHEEQAADLIEEVTPREAAAIIHEMNSDDRADLLSDLEQNEADAILQVMDLEEAEEARQLMEYPKDSAGGLMMTEFLAFPGNHTVEKFLEDLQINRDRYSDFDVQYTFITLEDKTLVGVLSLRNMLWAPRNQLLEKGMIANPIAVGAMASLDDLINLFDEHDFLGIPVVDEAGRIIGIVQRDVVREATEHRSSDSFLKASGIVGGEELRSMSLWLRARRRLSWLSINIGLNIVAASVIAFYQDTLASVIALAVFLPIISDMSGCSGNQAVAVSIRELTLGLIKPFEIVRVFFKEISIGIINGAVLGFMLGLVAFIWQGNPYLGLVVGGALMVNTIVAVCLGGLIPLVLQRFGKDPALASGPLLTTVTDLCGFFFALSFATLSLPLLTN